MEMQVQDSSVKTCCARIYESDAVRLLLGDSFHPGGMKLTERLGELLGLRPGVHLLDVASGKGASALHLAERFGCEVTGVDYGGENVAQANAEASARGLADRVRFVTGDAERLPCADAAFDAIICECAFCTFPDKPAAAGEFARVLKPGGRVGLSDLTRGEGELPPELDSLLAWVACIADAQPVERYAGFLQGAGIEVSVVEPQDWALTEMVNQIRMKLLGAEIMVGLKKIDLPDIDFASAKAMAAGALDAVRSGKLGYAIVAGKMRSIPQGIGINA
ncbi:MAG: class I SAM-dependent methyltransferase [Acidobacteria bacterium]|nr:class I SAM-dependent methyltransferase [Acidobacteriota bacterium]